MGRPPVKLLVNSTFGLLLAFALYELLQWALLWLGAALSAFDGQIEWRGFVFYVTARHWNFCQVLALFFFPELVFLLLAIFFPLQPEFSKNRPEILRLTFHWSGLFILVHALFIPFWDVVYHRGIYFALEWSGFSRPLQYAVALFALVIFLLNIFNISPLFSRLLPVASGQLRTPRFRSMFPHLVSVWYLPFLILVASVFFLSGQPLSFPLLYLLAGAALALLVNSPYINSYRVIVQ